MAFSRRFDADAPPLPFVDLAAQRKRIGPEIGRAIARVIEHGQHILGPEVARFERAMSAFCGAAHVVTCASGTDALALVLIAEGVGPGDAVFMPSFSFVAAAETVVMQRATPVFVDVDPTTFNIDPEGLDDAIVEAARAGLTPRMIIAVDLFGQPADYAALRRVADAHRLTLVADAAQSFGAWLGGRRVGTLADYTTTSFFPAKPLGCYGDGGAVLVDDGGAAEILGSLRAHGSGTERYRHVRIGLNSRLDTMQAAILLEKLEVFEEEIDARDAAAQRYDALLSDVVATPAVCDGAKSVWSQYTVRLRVPHDREKVRAACAEAGVPTAVYYPIPLHRQPAYGHFPRHPGGLAHSDGLADCVLSLPMHAYLDAPAQERVALALRSGLAP